MYLLKCLDIKKLYFPVQERIQVHGWIPELSKKATQTSYVFLLTWITLKIILHYFFPIFKLMFEHKNVFFCLNWKTFKPKSIYWSIMTIFFQYSNLKWTFYSNSSLSCVAITIFTSNLCLVKTFELLNYWQRVIA